LPRASCIVELDGATNIRKAREVLADWLCIKGDVRAPLLSLGQKEEVDTYCQELIEFMGRDGGFILGSGCEVPITAKPDNVAALISAARR
jgi:uroporphyrinogen-III decarboxylase